MNVTEGVTLTNRIASGRRRLFAGGILQLIAGMSCASGAALGLYALLMSVNMINGPAGLLGFFSLSLYRLVAVSVAAWFITMAQGSMSAKRWARTLTLAYAWPAIILGAFSFIGTIICEPMILKTLMSGGSATGDMVMFAIYPTVYRLVTYLVFPGLLLLLYSGKQVKETSEHDHAQLSWTDKHPLPFLATCLWFCFEGFRILSLMLVLSLFPLFGIFITGYAGLAMAVLALALFLVIVRGFYRRSISAWWGAVGVCIFVFVSFAVTLVRTDMPALLNQMEMGGPAMYLFELIYLLHSPGFAVQIICAIVLVLVLLLFSKRYFGKEGASCPDPESIVAKQA